jgi:ESS family glutamate:Na+ symporter
MQSPFPFELVLLFGFLSIMLLAGVALRARVQFCQRFLFPSCLIGGILGLVLMQTGLINLSITRLEAFAYHCFNISFISVGLTPGGSEESQAMGGARLMQGPAWMALMQGVTLPLQAIAGALVILVFGIMGSDLFPTFGFLSALGFNEGPGQALSIGKVWEGLGFQHAATIGLCFATIGFFFAFFVGVPLVNWGMRSGLLAHGSEHVPQELSRGFIPERQRGEPAGELRFHSSNVDTLAFQAALVGLAYLFGYAFVKLTGKILPPSGASTLWGFMFFVGLAIAFIIRWLLVKSRLGHLIDPGVQRRITGWSVDFLIVSTVAAIRLPIVSHYLLPILIISLIGGSLTTLAVVYLGRRLPAYNLERTVAIYGVVTGTVSSGLLLLRIADPDFRTPVALELAVMNVLAVPVVGGCMVILNAPVWWGWGLGLTMLVFAAIMTAALAAMRVTKLWGPLNS